MTFANKITRIDFFCLFNLFSPSKCIDLFEVIFLLRLDSLASKSIFVIKFACANLELKILAAKVLNSGVVIYSCCDYDQ